MQFFSCFSANVANKLVFPELAMRNDVNLLGNS